VLLVVVHHFHFRLLPRHHLTISSPSASVCVYL
jgi:hypothetical protein